MPAQPLRFNLSLDDRDDNDRGSTAQSFEDSDSRLMEMLAAQAAHREDGSATENENSITTNEKLSEIEKKAMLQKSLQNASSNGDVERVERLLHGIAKRYIDVDAPDEEGTAPLIYASCFVSTTINSLRIAILIVGVGPRGRSFSVA